MIAAALTLALLFGFGFGFVVWRAWESRAGALGVGMSATSNGHNCTCGYHESKRVVEREWDWLYRCPRCGAYQWNPEPEKAPAGTPRLPNEARSIGRTQVQGGWLPA